MRQPAFRAGLTSFRGFPEHTEHVGNEVHLLIEVSVLLLVHAIEQEEYCWPNPEFTPELPETPPQRPARPSRKSAHDYLSPEELLGILAAHLERVRAEGYYLHL